MRVTSNTTLAELVDLLGGRELSIRRASADGWYALVDGYTAGRAESVADAIDASLDLSDQERERHG